MSVGRGVWLKKRMVEECWDLDMKWLKDRIDFTKKDWASISMKSSWGRKFIAIITYEPRDPLVIHYHWYNAKSEINEVLSCRLQWEATPCNYGGFRYWFLCPSCFSRRRILYMPYGAKYFSCRICYNLCYESQQESKSMWWAMSRAMKDLPGWEEKYYRAKSPRKKAILKRKIDKVYVGMQNIVGRGRRYRRRSR